MASVTQKARAPTKARIPRLDKPRRDAAALEAQLDLALAHTFPASDPVSVGGTTGTEPPSRPVDRWPPIIDR
jgi:hypothetical protein